MEILRQATKENTSSSLIIRFVVDNFKEDVKKLVGNP